MMHHHTDNGAVRRFLDQHPIALLYISAMSTLTVILLIIDLYRR